MNVRTRKLLIVLCVIGMTSGLLLVDKIAIDSLTPINRLQSEDSHEQAVSRATTTASVDSEAKKLSTIMSYHVRLQSALARHVHTSKLIVAARNFETVGDWIHAHEQYTKAIFALQSDRSSGVRTSMDTALTGHIYAYIAKTFQMRGLNEEALKHINAAIKMDDLEKSFYDQRGKIYTALGRNREAEDDFRKSKSMEWTVDHAD